MRMLGLYRSKKSPAQAKKNLFRLKKTLSKVPKHVKKNWAAYATIAIGATWIGMNMDSKLENIWVINQRYIEEDISGLEAGWKHITNFFGLSYTATLSLIATFLRDVQHGRYKQTNKH